LILVNQDLAGFFTGIVQERFIGAWFMLVDFLRPHMNVAATMRYFPFPQGNPTIQVISSKAAPFVD
jgi:hypothetical protein